MDQAPKSTNSSIPAHLKANCDNLRIRAQLASMEGNVGDAHKFEVLIKVLEGKRIVSPEDLAGLELWLHKKADFLAGAQNALQESQAAATANGRKSENIDGELVLLVGDRKLYVNKYLLMSHSPIFREMLSSEGNEKKEVEIKDVQYEDMVSLLRFLNLEHQTITDDNVKGLLTLADRYAIQNLMVHCERVLIDTNKITIVDKFCHAGKYKLKELQKEVMKKITKAEIVTIFEDIEKFQIDTKTKDALLVKVCTMKDDKSRINSEKLYADFCFVVVLFILICVVRMIL